MVRFVSRLARVVPPSVAYPAGELIGEWVAASTERHPGGQAQSVDGTRGNPGKGTLDQAVRETVQNNVRDLYDLYHSLEHPEAVWSRICLNPMAEELVRRPEFSGRGLVIAGIHLSGFDSVMMTLIRRGVKGLVLTIPNPQGGRRTEYEMRRRTGMNILPASLGALRQAVRHLKKGGLVLTGIDRPGTDQKLRPRFFGQPACLPTHPPDICTLIGLDFSSIGSATAWTARWPATATSNVPATDILSITPPMQSPR